MDLEDYVTGYLTLADIDNFTDTRFGTQYTDSNISQNEDKNSLSL